MMKAHRGVIALLITVLIWGSTFVITKWALHDLGPFTLSAVRFVLAFAILAPLAARQGYRLRTSLEPTFLAFGLTGVALYYGLQNLGLRYTSAVSAVLVGASVSAVTALLAVWLLKERVTWRQMLCISLALVGAAITGLAHTVSVEAPRPLLGNVLLLGSMVSWAVYTIQGKRLSVNYPAMVSTTASIGAGLLILVPLGVGELALTGLPHLSREGALATLYLAVPASALPMFLWNYALNHTRASIASLYLNLIPFIGVAFALLTGEAITLWQVVGGLLTLAGVYLSGRTG